MSAWGEEMLHLCLCHQLLRSYRYKRAKQEVGNWKCVAAVFKKKRTILQEKKNIFFSSSLFGEVLETMPWFTESLSMAAWEAPYVFVMRVNVWGFSPCPSSPLAQRSGIRSGINQSCSLSPTFLCHIAPCVVDAGACAQTLGSKGDCVASPRS